MRHFTLSIRMPNSNQAHTFKLTGRRRVALAQQAARLVERFARSRGVSAFAVDYVVIA
jgi:hypothetical protein